MLYNSSLLLSSIAAHFPKEVARDFGLQRQPVNKIVADRGDNVPSRILMGIFLITIKDFNAHAPSPRTAC